MWYLIKVNQILIYSNLTFELNIINVKIKMKSYLIVIITGYVLHCDNRFSLSCEKSG